MRYFWIFLLVCGVCYGETINEKYDKPTNKKYSNCAFPYHDVSFKDVDPKEFNNTIIRSSCFYQECREDEEVIKDIFPDGMKGVVFIDCNLDNIYIPPGNIVKNSSNRRIKVQNDWEDWILEKKQGKWKPKKPMNKERRLKAGISINPKYIPKKKFTKKEREKFEKKFYHSDIISIP